jgi:hypothetical protein
MNKKVKITESQYNNLMKLLVESPFDQMTKSIIKEDDIVKISWKNISMKFKVVGNKNGRILMDSLETDSSKDYRFFMIYTSLDGNKLELRKINKITGKDKLDSVGSWPQMVLTDVKGIDVIRDGKIIDSVESIKPSEQDGTEDNGEVSDESFNDGVNNHLGLLFDELKKDKGVKLFLTNGEMWLCCYAVSDGVFTLEIVEGKSLPELNKWDYLNLKLTYSDDLFESNKSVVKTIDGGKTFSLLFDVVKGEDKSQIWINGINGISVTNTCGDFSETEEDKKETEEERIAREEKEDEERSKKSKEERDYENMKAEELRVFGKKAYDAIVNDPSLRAAFFTQPTFWEAFKSGLTGKKHPGHGMITTLNIVDKYMAKKVDTRLGGDFNLGEPVKFKFENPFELTYSDTNGNNQTAFIKGELEYTGRVKKAKSYDVRMIFVGDINLGVTIKDPVDGNDAYTFICDAAIYDDKGETEIGSKKEDIKTFITPSSTGYKPYNKNN